MKLSLIIPVYNQEKLIVRALDSIPNRNDLEIIVIDDCSTDGTYEVLKNYTRLPLKIIRNERNMGVGYSENRARDYVTGDWIQRLDSDDYLLTHNFSHLMNEINNKNWYNKYDIIYHDMEMNNGTAFTKNTQKYWSDAGATKIIKTTLWRRVQMENIRQGEDAKFAKLLWELEPKPRVLFYHDAMVYHYNYPRVGSLSWNWRHGISNEVK